MLSSLRLQCLVRAPKWDYGRLTIGSVLREGQDGSRPEAKDDDYRADGDDDGG